MTKGLKALHQPRIKSAKVDISVEGKHDIAYMFFDDTKQYTVIEKELKALEIIKEHIKLGSYKYDSDETYDLTEYIFFITKKEFDLLKEVLTDE